MTYAIGRPMIYSDMPSVRAIARQAAADNNRFEAIVLGVVDSDAFRKRAPATPAAGDPDDAGVQSDIRALSLLKWRHSNVPDQETSVPSYGAEGRRGDDLPATARCYGSGGHCAG